MTVVYDAGALIAADRSDRKLWTDHLVRLQLGLAPLTTAPVVAQAQSSRSPPNAWRPPCADGDRVGRIGGDEFLVICPDVADSSTALELGQRLAQAVAVDVVVGHQTVQLRASVGVAWTDQRLEADDFVAQADAAMYRKAWPAPG